MGLKGLKAIDPLTGAKRTLDDILDHISAHEIRNTYPTYSKVPPVIQSVRKLPMGNFVAFPSRDRAYCNTDHGFQFKTDVSS
jgi:hypothetical protein